MFIKQISVFLQNEEGRLSSALNALKQENINIVSCSLADTNDFGLLRLIVQDVTRAETALKAAGFSAHVSDVLAIKIEHTCGSLEGVIDTLFKAGINIEYMYALSTKDEKACIVIKPADKEACRKVFENSSLCFLTQEEIKNF